MNYSAMGNINVHTLLLTLILKNAQELLAVIIYYTVPYQWTLAFLFYFFGVFILKIFFSEHSFKINKKAY